MTIAEGFLAEFEHEVQITKKFLERLPADKLDWKPHEKSMTAGQLALHIAQVPAGIVTLAQESIVPAPDFSKGRPSPKSVQEVLDALEASIKTVREKLPKFTDAKMLDSWTATVNGQPVLSMPRVQFIRAIMLNHWIQHRGQFSVYLRLLGQKVPASYGPSADENPFG